MTELFVIITGCIKLLFGISYTEYTPFLTNFPIVSRFFECLPQSYHPLKHCVDLLLGSLCQCQLSWTVNTNEITHKEKQIVSCASKREGRQLHTVIFPPLLLHTHKHPRSQPSWISIITSGPVLSKSPPYFFQVRDRMNEKDD